MENHFEQLLSDHAVKPTPMRLLVLQTLFNYQAAGSISDLEEELEPTDRTTLYRTLKTFEQQGLVHPIDDGTGITKYALCSSACSAEAHADMHVHFHCTHCGSTICLPNTQIPPLKLPENYQSRDFNLMIQGICAACC